MSEHSGSELQAALTADSSQDAGAAELLSIEQFEVAFDSQVRPFLALLGVTSGTAHVTLTAEQLVARFGPWTCETAIGNVRDVCRTGPYHWYKAIGPRGSFVDRGLTFGTTARGGVCVLLREPVPGLTPVGPLRHPGITLDGFVTHDQVPPVRDRSSLVSVEQTLPANEDQDARHADPQRENQRDGTNLGDRLRHG